MYTEIIIPADAVTTRGEALQGWGEEYHRLTIDKPVRQLSVYHPTGQFGASVRFSPEGDVTLNNFGGIYTISAPQNLLLENSRPWPTEMEVSENTPPTN